MMSIVLPALRYWIIPLRVSGGIGSAERSGVVLPIRQNPDTLIHPGRSQ
jgi:hypothetical protein